MISSQLDDKKLKNRCHSWLVYLDHSNPWCVLWLIWDLNLRNTIVCTSCLSYLAFYQNILQALHWDSCFFHRLSCFSPNWHVEALITNLTVFGGRAFKEEIKAKCHKSGHWSNRNGFFVRRGRGIIALYCSERTHRKQDRCGHREDTVYKPRRELSPETNPARPRS